MTDRPDPPMAWVERVRGLLADFDRCREEEAWTGVRWRVGAATVAHLFGGHDQRFRLTFRADPDEVIAFGHLGPPYFRVGGNAVGLLLDEATDWQEVGELLTDSYCIQAPAHLAGRVQRPERA